MASLRDPEAWLIDVVVELVCSYLPPAAVARLGMVSRSLRHQVFASEEAERLWPLRFSASFSRALIRGPGDWGLSSAQLYARKAARRALKAPPCTYELGVGVSQRTRGGSVHVAPGEEVEGPRLAATASMRYVALTPAASIAVATSTQGAAVAWLPLLRRPVLPPSAQGDIFTAALAAKARRDAKAKYPAPVGSSVLGGSGSGVVRGGSGGGSSNPLLFFKIAAVNRDSSSLEIWSDSGAGGGAAHGGGRGASFASAATGSATGGRAATGSFSGSEGGSSEDAIHSPALAATGSVGGDAAIAMPSWALDLGDDSERSVGSARSACGGGGGRKSGDVGRPKGKELWSANDRAKREGRDLARKQRADAKAVASATAAAAAAATALGAALERVRLSSLDSAEGSAGVSSSGALRPLTTTESITSLEEHRNRRGMSLSFQDSAVGMGDNSTLPSTVPSAEALADLLVAGARKWSANDSVKSVEGGTSSSPRSPKSRGSSSRGGSIGDADAFRSCSAAASEFASDEEEDGDGNGCGTGGGDKCIDTAWGGTGRSEVEERSLADSKFARRQASRKLRRTQEEARRSSMDELKRGGSGGSGNNKGRVSGGASVLVATAAAVGIDEARVLSRRKGSTGDAERRLSNSGPHPPIISVSPHPAPQSALVGLLPLPSLSPESPPPVMPWSAASAAAAAASDAHGAPTPPVLHDTPHSSPSKGKARGPSVSSSPPSPTPLLTPPLLTPPLLPPVHFYFGGSSGGSGGSVHHGRHNSMGSATGGARSSPPSPTNLPQLHSTANVLEAGAGGGGASVILHPSTTATSPLPLHRGSSSGSSGHSSRAGVVGAAASSSASASAPPEVSFACHWTTLAPKLVRRWVGSEEDASSVLAPPRALGSGNAAVLHAVLAFSDGSLGVVAPVPVSPHPSDCVLEGASPGAGALVETLHLAQPRTRGAKHDGGFVAVPEWAPRGITWLERPVGESARDAPITGVCVVRGRAFVRPPLPGEATTSIPSLRKLSMSGGGSGVIAAAGGDTVPLATPIALSSGVEPDYIFAAFGRAVGAWECRGAPVHGVAADGGEDAGSAAAAVDEAVSSSPRGSHVSSKKALRRKQTKASPIATAEAATPNHGSDSAAVIAAPSLKPSFVSRLHAHVVTSLACHRSCAPSPLPGHPLPPLVPGVRSGAFSGLPLRDAADVITLVSGDVTGEIILWRGCGPDAGAARIATLSLSGLTGGVGVGGSTAPITRRSAFSPLASAGGGSGSSLTGGAGVGGSGAATAGGGGTVPSRTEGVACLALSASHIVAGGSEGTVCIWRRRFAAPHGCDSTQEPLLSPLPSSATTLSMANALPLVEGPPELLHREPRVHSLVRAIFLPGGSSSAPAAAAVHPPLSLTAPPHATCLTGGSEGDVRLWTLPPPPSAAAASPTPPRVLESRVLRSHTGRITGLGADMSKVVTASLDGSVKVWDVHSGGGAPLHTLRFPPHPHGGGPSGVSSLSVVGDALVAGLVDGRVFFVELGGRSKVHAPAGLASPPPAAMPAAAIFEANSGRRGGAASGGAARMRDLRTALRGHRVGEDEEAFDEEALARAWEEL